MLEKTFGKLKSSEVIITRERMDHIREGHGDDFGFIMGNMCDTITNPSILFVSTKGQETVHFIKETKEGNIDLVVKLILDQENTEKLNSVLTGYRVGEKRLNRYFKSLSKIYG